MSFLLAARQGRSGVGVHIAGAAVVIVLYVFVSLVAAAILFGIGGVPDDPETIPTLPLGAVGPAATLAILLLPVYIALLFFPPFYGIVFYGVNGYLLGREYYEGDL